MGAGGRGDRERLTGRLGSVEARGEPTGDAGRGASGTVVATEAGEGADGGKRGKGGDDGTTSGEVGDDGISMITFSIATKRLEQKLQLTN